MSLPKPGLLWTPTKLQDSGKAAHHTHFRFGGPRLASSCEAQRSLRRLAQRKYYLVHRITPAHVGRLAPNALLPGRDSVHCIS